MRKALLLVVGIGAGVLAAVRRRKAQDSTALWREATSDASR